MRLLAAVTVMTLLGNITFADAAREPARDLDDLLARSALAITTGNEQLFVETLDPKSDTSFKDRQLRSFRGLARLAPVDLQYTVMAGSVDVAYGLDLDERYAADNVALPETRMSFRIGTFDEFPQINSLFLTYVERGGEWFVAGDVDASVLGLKTTPNIWDLHDVATIESEHFVTIHRPDQSQRAVMLSDIAERAMDEFEATWRRPWSGRIPIIVPASPEDAAKLLDTDSNVNSFVAFVAYRTLRDPDGWTISAPRLYAQDANLADNSLSSQVDTIVHELVHAASAQYSGPFTPAWLHEGLAEWVWTGRRTDVAPASDGRLELPAAGDFAGAGNELRNAYADSHSAISLMANLYGADAPERVFEAVGARRLQAGTPSYNVDDAFRSTTGVSITEFEATWSQRFGR